MTAETLELLNLSYITQVNLIIVRNVPLFWLLHKAMFRSDYWSQPLMNSASPIHIMLIISLFVLQTSRTYGSMKSTNKNFPFCCIPLDPPDAHL